MSIAELYQLFLQHTNITTDSRSIQPGAIFFALKGDNFNGNEYAQKAIESGAAFAVIDEAQHQQDERYLLVDDVLTTLQQLATHHRKTLAIPILAITGTNGKTTTKELTTAVLSKKFKTAATKGNFNNHIGVPLTLLSFNRETEFGVVEMGANHPGEIKALCEIALPNYGLITNVGKAHLEGFGSFEGVINTKTEMYRHLESNDGKIFINQANTILTKKTGRAETINYSTTKGLPGIEGELMQSSPFMVFRARFPKGWLYCKTHLIGGYNLENALAAAAIGNYFGVDPLLIVQAIESYQPSNNRSQFVKTISNSVLMDAYNANPTSMAAALENFKTYQSAKKCAILGDMLELGETSAEEHQKIADQLVQLQFDRVFLVGPQFAKTKVSGNILHFPTISEVISHLETDPVKNAAILIKGSRGMKLEQLLERL